MKDVIIELVAKIFLIIGGLDYFSENFFNYKILNKSISYIIAFFVGISALVLMFNRDFYLPFLGKCAFPKQVNNTSVNLSKKTTVVLEGLPPNVNVVYWAGKPGDSPVLTYIQAYKGSYNSGSLKSDDKGQLSITLDCPPDYSVPVFGMIKRHVHYRYELPEYIDVYSKVYTKIVEQC